MVMVIIAFSSQESEMRRRDVRGFRCEVLGGGDSGQVQVG
jgi:hypothetical protein